jgi:hypothetical protein
MPSEWHVDLVRVAECKVKHLAVDGGLEADAVDLKLLLVPFSTPRTMPAMMNGRAMHGATNAAVASRLHLYSVILGTNLDMRGVEALLKPALWPFDDHGVVDHGRLDLGGDDYG